MPLRRIQADASGPDATLAISWVPAGRRNKGEAPWEFAMQLLRYSPKGRHLICPWLGHRSSSACSPCQMRQTLNKGNMHGIEPRLTSPHCPGRLRLQWPGCHEVMISKLIILGLLILIGHKQIDPCMLRLCLTWVGVEAQKLSFNCMSQCKIPYYGRLL